MSGRKSYTLTWRRGDGDELKTANVLMTEEEATNLEQRVEVLVGVGGWFSVLPENVSVDTLEDFLAEHGRSLGIEGGL